MKRTVCLLTTVLLVSGAVAGIQPAEVENTTLRLDFNATEVFRSGLQTTPGEYQASDYPYLSSGEPEALVPYGDTEELTNIYMPDGLVAYYPLDETSGDTANDITTALPDNDGTHVSLNQDSLGVGASISRGYDFDGVDDKVLLPAFLDSNQDFTVSAFVNADAFPNPRHRIVSKSRGQNSRSGSFSLDIDSQNNEPRFIIRGDSNTLKARGGSLPTDTPALLTATFDASAGTAKLYRDGAQVGSASGVSSISPLSDQPLSIGEDEPEGTAAEYFDGVIDDVRIYNRSLSQKEVQRLHNYQGEDQPGTEQISASITSGGFVLANTKDGTPAIESRSEAVESRTLLSQISPSFAFQQPRGPPTTQIVYRSPYNLTGDSFSSASSGITLRSTAGLGDNATVSVAPRG